MGKIRDYICSCGYQKKIFAGAGINGCNLNAIMRFFPEEAKLFLKEKEAGKVKSYLLENATVECFHCKSLESVPCFSYQTEEGLKTCIMEKCPTCGSQVTRVEDEEHIKCPKCGLPMGYSETGDWD